MYRMGIDMDKKVQNKQLAKKFYMLAGVALLLAVVGTLISYNSNEMFSDVPNTTAEMMTKQAEIAKTDVPDERQIQNNTEDDTTALTQRPQESQTEAQKQEEKTSQTTASEQTTAAKTVSQRFVLPLSGEVSKKFSLTQPQYSKTMGDWRVHTGTDFVGTQGQDVCSVGNGTVSKVYSDTKWGYVIEIDYGSFTARYCGLAQEGAVGIDEKVSTGEVIGKLTAIPIEEQDGVHLHFEAIKDGVCVDPSTVLSD